MYTAVHVFEKQHYSDDTNKVYTHTQQSVIAYSFFQLKREGSCFEWFTIVTDPQWTGITTGSTSISIIPLHMREREGEGERGREGE